MTTATDKAASGSPLEKRRIRAILANSKITLAVKEIAFKNFRKSQIALPLEGTRPPQISVQATRWIVVKEDSAKNIITTVSEYMLAQRVKKELFESDADYREALVAHHVLMQAAVKAKQVVDVAACDALDHAIADVGAMYTKK